MNDPRMPAPSFPGIVKPGTDFAAVRDQRRAFPQFYLVDLSTARSIAAGTHLQLPLNGNSFYCDPIIDSSGVPIGGVARVVFQDASLSPRGVPFTVAPQFIARIPFTQIIVENPAQPGKFLQINYGVDLDFTPGINAQVSIAGVVATREQGVLYGSAFASNTNINSGANEVAVAPGTNVNGITVWAAEIFSTNSSTSQTTSLLAKASAPASLIDGDLLLGFGYALFSAAGASPGVGELPRPVFVSAGKGLYFRNGGGAIESNAFRKLLFTVH